jgi:hypothetical protein
MEHTRFLATINFTDKLKDNTIGNVFSLKSLTLIYFVFNSKKKKNRVNKINDGNPSNKRTRQMKLQINTTQRKKKNQTINKNQVKTLSEKDSWLATNRLVMKVH